MYPSGYTFSVMDIRKTEEFSKWQLAKKLPGAFLP
jgi:hypothetical protein